MEDSTFIQNATAIYFDGQFPPKSLKYSLFIDALLSACSGLAQYDQYVNDLGDTAQFLRIYAYLDAVLAARFDGVFISIDELLRYQADSTAEVIDNAKPRAEVVKASAFANTYAAAQTAIVEGYSVSPILIKALHQQLFSSTDAAALPGRYKSAQHGVMDKPKGDVSFIPIAPENLKEAMAALWDYLENDTTPDLIKAAIGHAEFLALHPFTDGNNRIARIFTTLILYKYGLIRQPHFYFGHSLALHKAAYIDAMRSISCDGHWEVWCQFFAQALSQQAQVQLAFAQNFNALYQSMQPVISELLSSKWSQTVLDFLFTTPVFRNNTFTHHAGIPPATAARFTKTLLDEGLIQTMEEGSGRRPALYSFEPLLQLLRV